MCDGRLARRSGWTNPPLDTRSAGHRGPFSKRIDRKAAQPARHHGRRPSLSTKKTDMGREIAVIVWEGYDGREWCCARPGRSGFLLMQIRGDKRRLDVLSLFTAGIRGVLAFVYL